MAGTPPCPPSPSFDIDRTPAVVEWLGVDAEPRFLFDGDTDLSRQVTFEMRFDAASQAAFFKIRVPIGLKGTGHDSVKTPLFLHIHPDRIASLDYTSPIAVPDLVRTNLGSSLSCFRFSLSRPADLVAPSISALVPQNKGYGEKLDSLKLLAQETTFSVYWKHPTALSDAQLRPLCDAVAARTLKSISAAAELQGLYGGAGGKVLEGSELCIPVPKTGLPSYSELAPPPPGPPVNLSQKPGGPRKRRRGSPSGASSRPDLDVTAACKKMLDDMMSQYRQEERAYVDSSLEQLRTSLSEDLRQVKAEMLEHVDQRVNELEGVMCSAEDVDEQVSQQVMSFEDLIEVKIDDHVAGIKLELEEFVDSEIADAEDRVLQRVQAASWTVALDE
ncbi:hypothetical protein DHEL01_v204475 [Diaporthe helianthi]|uniref:Uncharacterized protein n=1 Tax=Diaporthe helianthi TaxID=158607 RepID=A0A2P5I3R1_DIAHE|nr:hypothetical protein DHEL01_v204475 [Diaporthe helianthi]